MFYDVKSSKTKLVMLSSIMQYLKKKMDFYKCFHEVFVKNLTKKLSHLATKFQDLFEHVCIIASPCVFIFKFYVLFYFCHHTLFNISVFYLFISLLVILVNEMYIQNIKLIEQFFSKQIMP